MSMARVGATALLARRCGLSTPMTSLMAAIALGYRAQRLAVALTCSGERYGPARLGESVATSGERDP